MAENNKSMDKGRKLLIGLIIVLLLLTAGAQNHQHQRRQNPTKKPFHCVTPNRFLKNFSSHSTS